MNVRREDIIEGRMEAMLEEAERKGGFKRMRPEEREKSRIETLSRLPEGEDVWLFGYGSLMWNPAIHYLERKPARLHGYHRQFCLWTTLGRGSESHPGLMLALRPGGSCKGIVYRVAADQVNDELAIVWNREMVSGAYVPKVLDVKTENGPIKAVVFVINHRHERYAGKLTNDTIVQAIAHAEGPIGLCRDYLYSTVEHMDDLGIADGAMHSLARQVRSVVEKDQAR